MLVEFLGAILIYIVNAFMQVVVRFIPKRYLTQLIEGILNLFYKFDQEIFLDCLLDNIVNHSLGEVEKKRFFIRTSSLLSPSDFSDALINAIEDASGGALHYSQEGEDIILARLLAGKNRGFFVDIGAHHPTRFSNTYALYRKGWRGLNVDATPGSMESFNKTRPDDINLELAISDRKESLIFSMFKESALNTFDQQLARGYVESGWETQGSVELFPRSLAEVLDKHLKPGQNIDLLSIDVEGEDMGVLRSNDWSRYCPDIIIIEALNTPMENLDESPVVEFLKEKGFVATSRLFNSIILQRSVNVCAAS